MQEAFGPIVGSARCQKGQNDRLGRSGRWTSNRSDIKAPALTTWATFTPEQTKLAKIAMLWLFFGSFKHRTSNGRKLTDDLMTNTASLLNCAILKNFFSVSKKYGRRLHHHCCPSIAPCVTQRKLQRSTVIEWQFLRRPLNSWPREGGRKDGKALNNFLAFCLHTSLPSLHKQPPTEGVKQPRLPGSDRHCHTSICLCGTGSWDDGVNVK